MEKFDTLQARGGGRRTYEGRTRQIKLSDDVHKWITSHGGGRFKFRKPLIRLQRFFIQSPEAD
jgi:hypothetical protein